MSKYRVEDIRNVALAGHGASGKTSLADALLFKAKVGVDTNSAVNPLRGLRHLAARSDSAVLRPNLAIELAKDLSRKLPGRRDGWLATYSPSIFSLTPASSGSTLTRKSSGGRPPSFAFQSHL